MKGEKIMPAYENMDEKMPEKDWKKDFSITSDIGYLKLKNLYETTIKDNNKPSSELKEILKILELALEKYKKQ